MLSKVAMVLVLAVAIGIAPGSHQGISQAAWSGWTELPGGGRTLSAPTAVVGSALFLFVRGLNDGIWQNFLNTSGSTWSGWNELPGGGRTPSSPAAFVTGFNGLLYVFVRGANDGVWVNVLNPFTNNWSGWSELPGGGRTLSAPAAVVYGGRLHLFVRGLNDGIWMNALNETEPRTWSGWSELPSGGRTLSSPAAVAESLDPLGGSLAVFVRGTNDGIWQNVLNRLNGTWSGWNELPGGGRTLSSPTAVMYNNRLHLFVRGLNDGVWENMLTIDSTLTGPWTGWGELPGGGRTSSEPTAVAFNGLRLFVRGLNDGVWQNIFRMSSTQAANQRATEDRPDDVSGYQIHIMYVLPSDGTDEQLDTNGVISRSVAAFQRWFANQADGRRLRIDTYQGNVDITFLRFGRNDSQIRSFNAFVRDQIEIELRVAGFTHPQKLYAVYYGGSSNFACGGGAWPPQLIGKVAALYLRGAPPGFTPCSTNRFAATELEPGYWEFSMIHEIFHTLGAVATCAPNHLSGHTSDDPRDLMYAGSQPWRPSSLDRNRDDYFGHSNSGCLDIAKSVFMEPTAPNAVLPPGW